MWVAPANGPSYHFDVSVLCRTCITTFFYCHGCCRYINKPHDKAGTAVKLVVRGKANDATVTKMPFVKTTYYRPS